MGITIHIKGRLREPSHVTELTDEVAEYARILGWELHVVEPPPLAGMFVTPHPRCEPLALLFDADGVLRNTALLCEGYDDVVSVKTQFAGADAHIALCKLLRHLMQRYFAVLVVADEGEYWNTGDRALLESKLRVLNDAMPYLETAMAGRLAGGMDDDGNAHMDRIIQAAEDAFARTGLSRLQRVERLNGPQPPFLDENSPEWDTTRWLLFWRAWDMHRCPALALLSNKPETLENVRTVLDEGDKILDRMEKESLELFLDPEEDTDEDDPLTSDGMFGEPDFGSGYFGDEDSEDDTSPEAYAIAKDWFIRFGRSPEKRQENPVARFAYSAVAPALVGIRLAYVWKNENEMFLAIPTRIAVCVERFEMVSRILRLDPGNRFAQSANEALSIARRLSEEES